MKEIIKLEASKRNIIWRIISGIIGSGLIIWGLKLWYDWGKSWWYKLWNEPDTILPIIMIALGAQFLFKGSLKNAITIGIMGLASIVYAMALLNGRGEDTWENPKVVEFILFAFGGISLVTSIIVMCHVLKKKGES